MPKIEFNHSVPNVETYIKTIIDLLERVVLALTPSKEKFTNVYRNTRITTVDQISREPRVLHGYHLYNTNAAMRVIRFYDKDNIPNLTNDVPILTIPLAGNDSAYLWMARGIHFAQGLAVGVSTGAADYNATAPTAGDVIVNVFYE